MQITFLGTGGTMATPRPFCECGICEKARDMGEPYKRNSSSIYINDIKGLIDCPEDIGDSLNRRRIMDVDHLFITHWHPDHTFGLRPVLEANYNFRENKADKKINMYVAKKVYDDLLKFYPALGYHINVLKTCKVSILEHNTSIEINGIKATAIGYQGSGSNIYAYLIQEKEKSVLYAPCDTIGFKQEVTKLNLLINECGIFSPEIKTEISFCDLINKIKNMNVQKTLFTHIEEIELNRYGWNYLAELKNAYPEIDFEFAYDGMTVQI